MNNIPELGSLRELPIAVMYDRDDGSVCLTDRNIAGQFWLGDPKQCSGDKGKLSRICDRLRRVSWVTQG